MESRPERLDASFHEKIWGSKILSPWFADSEKTIGEVWFTRRERLPLLVKFLFTTENLSVQVHPGGAEGKTEMWHILRAEPGAKIALGLRDSATVEQVRKASQTGSIMELLQWFPVVSGETYFIPAGTIHAIGAGITLCEIQQNCDITYRLYDYGRDRPLHLDEGLRVSHLGPHPGKSHDSVRCEYFCSETMAFDAPVCHQVRQWELLAIVEGQGTYGNEPFRAGEVWYVPPEAPSTWLHPNGTARMLRVWLPAAQ